MNSTTQDRLKKIGEALSLIASGNSDPDVMVQYAQDVQADFAEFERLLRRLAYPESGEALLLVDYRAIARNLIEAEKVEEDSAQTQVDWVMDLKDQARDRCFVEIEKKYIDRMFSRPPSDEQVFRCLVQLAIIRHLVMGFLLHSRKTSVSVHNGESWVIRGSHDVSAILGALGAGKPNRLAVHDDDDPQRIGTIMLDLSETADWYPVTGRNLYEFDPLMKPTLDMVQALSKILD